MKIFIKTTTIIIGVFCTLLLLLSCFLNRVLPSQFYVSSTGREDLSAYGVTLTSYNNSKENTVQGQLMLGNIIPIKSVEINVKANETVVPCGIPFGIKLFTNGVMVVKLESITVNNKTYNPARDSGIEIGDVITMVNSKKVTFTEDLPIIVNQSKGKPIQLTIVRNGKTINKSILPVDTGNGNYKIGIWVRDSSAGIGTMTFYHTESNAFGGLGHGICDIDTGTLLPISQGEITGAKIDSITKAKSGSAGTLNGHHCDNQCNGYVICNSECGVFGYLQSSPTNNEPIPVAYKQQIKIGKAEILSTIQGEKPKYYDVEITSINYNEYSKTKNIVLKVTDNELLDKTNGIIQGMSGSPIIQNGRLVGAVTHVFVNEPNMGYGIFAENMIDELNTESRTLLKDVA